MTTLRTSELKKGPTKYQVYLALWKISEEVPGSEYRLLPQGSVKTLSNVLGIPYNTCCGKMSELRKSRCLKPTGVQAHLISPNPENYGLVLPKPAELASVAVSNDLAAPIGGIELQINTGITMPDLRKLVDHYTQVVPSGIAGEFIGVSTLSKMLRKRITLAASLDKPTLITGESGVGKGLVAQIIHRFSHRQAHGMHEVNCGAIPENLLESELFGHEAGSFTGAVRRHEGWFERANHGTVFLDEIGDAPRQFQVKLLRVLDNGIYYRVGGETAKRTDVRVLAATNQDLVQGVHEGTFREDLYYRLYGIPVNIPPLRERREDILHLIAYYVSEWERAVKKTAQFDQAAIDALYGHHWRGNVRELKAVLESGLAWAGADGGKVQLGHLEFSALSSTNMQ